MPTLRETDEILVKIRQLTRKNKLTQARAMAIHLQDILETLNEQKNEEKATP